MSLLLISVTIVYSCQSHNPFLQHKLKMDIWGLDVQHDTEQPSESTVSKITPFSKGKRHVPESLEH